MSAKSVHTEEIAFKKKFTFKNFENFLARIEKLLLDFFIFQTFLFRVVRLVIKSPDGLSKTSKFLKYSNLLFLTL